ncbi:hypothetical protein IT407_03190 [Candidatus Uhrbacteria bacterium]|nr:hypothetical protein [Candidatus Uhrbacteria bacterium]
MSTELQLFVKEGLSKGISKSKLKEALKQANWPADDVEAALSNYADVDFPIAVPKRKPYLSAREAFMYLVMFLTLYISTFSLGTILFQFINRAFPDAAAGDYSYLYDSTTGIIRSATAALIITFPIFFWMARSLRTAMSKDPEKRGSKVRKWLTYVTLFVAASVIIGDLITLVSYFLSGEITTRFLLKVLVVLVIAGSIFGYYLWDLRGEEKEPGKTKAKERPMAVKAFIGFVLAAVTIVAAAGLWTSGSPAKERARRLDERRVSDLQSVSYAADQWYRINKSLPESLDTLSKGRDVYVSGIVDPETGMPYEYRVLGAMKYELCAAFETDSNSDGVASPIMFREPTRFWEHPAGRYCYTIDIIDEKPVTQP